MPGTKIEMKVGDDPDPAPFLFVNEEIKAKIAAKVYDPKRSAYVPHPEEKYVEVKHIFSHILTNEILQKEMHPFLILPMLRG